MVDPVAVTQIVVGTLGPTERGFKVIFGSLKRKWGYVKNLKENWAELDRQAIHLGDQEADIQRIIRWNVDGITTHVCSRWLTNVEEKKQMIEILRTRHNNIKQCFCGLYPLRSLLRLGKDIVTETEKVKELIRTATHHDQVIAHSIPDRFVRRPTDMIDDVPSLNVHAKRVQELLKEDGIKKIRIWGRPGVGKTTVMKNLHNRVGETNLFDIIFWVTIPENRSMEANKAIQQVLEERLGLQEDQHCSGDRRRERISRELEKRNSYLLFLDQVDSAIDLKEVGIDVDREGTKVVFAGNYRRTGNDEDIHIKGLSEDDARKLFNKTVRADILMDPEINDKAKLIVGECGGCLQLIKVIASQLARVSDPAVWRDKLSKLQKPSFEQSRELEDYFRFFKLAYDDLKQIQKRCLLYWEVFPTGYEIHRDYIIECWRTEQFLTLYEKFGQTRDTGHGILNEFVDTCLLETGRNARHYKMFSLFQPAAARIADSNRGSHQLLVKGGKEEWRNAERVSLISHRLSALPDNPQCFGVRTLLLQGNQSLMSIPEAFFACMENLKLLDLRDTGISSLPSSISSLKNLIALYLNHCKELEELPSEIGQLQSLEIFDLSGTGINGLLTKIDQLTNLKCLRVSLEQDVSSHNHIQDQRKEEVPKTISKLTLLEELSIFVSHSNTKWNSIVDTIVEQVAGLKELTTLCFYFPKVDCLEIFTRESKSWNRENEKGENTEGSGFRSFYIAVGHQTSSFPAFDTSECSAEKHLTFSAGEGTPHAILHVLKRARSLELIGHQTMKNLSQFGTDELGGLEVCKIEGCKKMESIIDGNVTGDTAFQCLKKLHIVNVEGLVHLWEGPKSLQTKSLSSLMILILKDCRRLRKLFSKQAEGIAQQLSRLQHLEVDNCLEMDEIIETGSVVESMAFPKLETIELRRLPNLCTIWPGPSMKWPSLETIEIEECMLLKDLPSTMQDATKLTKIRCTDDWKYQLQWPSDDVKVRFQNILMY